MAVKHVLVACDSFKGCLDSPQVGNAVAEGARQARPDVKVKVMSVGDGGEGTMQAIVDGRHGEILECRVAGPLLREVTARYGLCGRLAVIEMAQAAGLDLVEPSQRNPMLTTTLGVGQLISHALDRGCRDFLICIGGSATNDAGVGMLHALGFRFYDADGHELWQGGECLERIARIDASQVHPGIRESHFTVACDVQNPFYGPQGAAAVFGPQKGADAEMVQQLDRGMHHFADLLLAATGVDVQRIPGSGAAGGMGGGMVALLGAALRPGIEMVLDAIDFEAALSDVDLVITGEGRLDSQTLMGKTPFGILRHAAQRGIPVVAIAGSVSDSELLCSNGFAAVLPIQPGPVALDRAMDPLFAADNLRHTAFQIMRLTDLKS